MNNQDDLRKTVKNKTSQKKKGNRKCMQPITPLWATKCKTA